MSFFLRNFLPILICSLLPHALQAVFPPDFKITGEFVKTPEGFLTPKGEKVVLESAVPDGQPVLRFRGRVGKGNEGAINIRLKNAEGGKKSLILRSLDLKADTEVFPDAVLSIGWPEETKFGWGTWNFRPNPAFYRKEEWESRKEDWKKLPSAPESSFTWELHPVEGRIELWIEGQLMHSFEFSTPSTCLIEMRAGSRMESLQWDAASPRDSFFLPVERSSRAGAFGRATLKFDNPAALPPAFLGMEKATGISVDGLGEFNQWRNDDLQSFFWRRHASHALPEQRMFSVPLAVYSHAWVLCAVEDRPGKTDDFTFRVTRYGNSRGNAMADTVVRVNADNTNARRVGTVTTEQGATAPLWLVRVPIYNGLIQDLLYEDTRKSPGVGTHRYLDVELLNPLANAAASRAFPPPMDALHRRWKPTDSTPTSVDIYPSAPPRTSGVTVFGILLEQSSAALRLSANPDVKAFYESEGAEFLAEVRATKAGEYLVEWSVADVDGAIVDSVKQTLKLEAGASGEARLPVKNGRGWFAVRARLLDAKGNELVDKQSSYVMLPPDTRQAGYESPFYGWWFDANHSSPIALEQSGPLLQRLGIRRVELRPDAPESLTKKYGFTNSTVSWHGEEQTKFIHKEYTLAEALAKYEEHIRSELELWPSIDRMLVFHETGAKGAPFPSEMWGTPARNSATIQDENSPQALLDRENGLGGMDLIRAKSEAKDHDQWGKTWPGRLEYVPALAKMVREKFPRLKMQYGNDGNSLGIVGELFRQKFPRELMDTLSIEDLGQTIIPENPRLGGVHSAWFLREVARKMGYGDVPVTACPEWIGRMTEKLGLRTQAEWKARDALLGLAYGFDTISVAGLNDAGDGYYFSIWANGGLTGRWPEMAPKPAYAAIATLTQVLDRAKFQRWVPTGSTVFYAQEFKRDGEWVYAFWTPRGTRKATVEFPSDAKRRLMDLYGREQTVTGKTVDFTAGTGVSYLTSKDQLQSIHAGATAFPEDPVPREVKTEIPLDSLDAIEVFSRNGLEESSKQPVFIPKYRRGKFEVREVEDEEMGKCLEIELLPEGEIWDMTHEYISLKLRKPVPTDADNAGLWIKGNGSWGRVDILKSQATGPWATNANLHMNWSGLQTLNFDGWNFLRYPYYDWIRGSKENSVTGLEIAIPRKTIVGTDMQPVKSLKVRIKKIVLF